MKYFISFIEESILNPDYLGYWGGRMEVYDEVSEYDIDEIRFLTKDPSFIEFREKWDFKDVSKRTLNKIEKEIREKYYERAI